MARSIITPGVSRESAERYPTREGKPKRKKHPVELTGKDTNELLKELILEVRKLKEANKELVQALRPEGRNVWFQTGRKSIPNVATQGNWGEYEVLDFLRTLDYPAREGTIQNFGPGTIYVALMKTPSRVTYQEAEILSNSAMEWTTDDGYQVIKIYLRTDQAGTEYQCIAG